jgi:hypothetical protein
MRFTVIIIPRYESRMLDLLFFAERNISGI